VDDLEVPDLREENETVDVTAFWRQVQLSILARGLLRGTIIGVLNYCTSRKRGWRFGDEKPRPPRPRIFRIV